MLSNQIGQIGENIATDYLKKQGLKFIAHNFTCRYGEIDIIMRDKNTLIFVEVKSRKISNFGDGFDAINHTKQQKIQKTALVFVQQQSKWQDYFLRFDAVAISYEQTIEKSYKINWLQNAFGN